jgi:hypothetical protein
MLHTIPVSSVSPCITTLLNLGALLAVTFGRPHRFTCDTVLP